MPRIKSSRCSVAASCIHVMHSDYTRRAIIGWTTRALVSFLEIIPIESNSKGPNNRALEASSRLKVLLKV